MRVRRPWDQWCTLGARLSRRAHEVARSRGLSGRTAPRAGGTSAASLSFSAVASAVLVTGVALASVAIAFSTLAASASGVATGVLGSTDASASVVSIARRIVCSRIVRRATARATTAGIDAGARIIRGIPGRSVHADGAAHATCRTVRAGRAASATRSGRRAGPGTATAPSTRTSSDSGAPGRARGSVVQGPSIRFHRAVVGRSPALQEGERSQRRCNHPSRIVSKHFWNVLSSASRRVRLDSRNDRAEGSHQELRTRTGAVWRCGGITHKRSCRIISRESFGGSISVVPRWDLQPPPA